jgi:DNA replication protein DnaC
MMNQKLHYCSTEDFYGVSDAEALERFKSQAKSNAAQLVEKTIPALYRHSDTGKLNQKMLAGCEAWKVGSLGLGLVGKTGIGKTRCMYRMLRRLIENPKIDTDERHPERPTHSCRIPRIEAVNDAVLAKLVLAALDFDDTTGASRRLRDFHSTEILFLDDVGQSKISERVGAELYEMVEYRTSNLKPILFTSNFRGRQLAEKFTDTTRGDAVVRRLAEFCTIIVGDAS